MSITSPSDISGLVHRLQPHAGCFQDAAGTTPASVGDPVGYVPNTISSGDPATQSTLAKKPTLVSGDNGWSAIETDGVDDLVVATWANIYTTITLVTVYKVVSYVDANQFLVDRGGGGDRTILWATSANEVSLFVTGGPRYTVSITEGVRSVDIANFLGTNSIHRIDGVEATTPGDDIGTCANCTGVTLGSHYVGTSRQTNAEYYDLLVYDRQLTSTERADLDTYLTALYSSPPAGSTIEASGGAEGGSSAANTIVVNQNTSGGLLAAGSADVSSISVYDETSTGGIVAGGLSDIHKIAIPTTSGGAVLGGTADLSTSGTFDEVASGGILASGSATITTTGNYNEIASGGVVLSGASTVTNVASINTSGGIVAGRSAIVGTEANIYDETAEGGIAASGSATISIGTTGSFFPSACGTVTSQAAGAVCGGSASVEIVGDAYDGFAAVYDLQGSYDGTQYEVIDSTRNELHGTSGSGDDATTQDAGLMCLYSQRGSERQYISLPADGLTTTQDYAVSFWAKITGNHEERVWYSRGIEDEANDWVFSIGHTVLNHVWVQVQTDDLETVNAYSSTLLSENTWYHIAIDYIAGESINIWIDGELETTQEIANFVTPVTNGGFIGGWNEARGYTGNIMLLRVHGEPGNAAYWAAEHDNITDSGFVLIGSDPEVLTA